MPNVQRKRRARETELAAAKYLAEKIWPGALAVGSGTQGSDITNVPVDIEVKARRDFNPLAWVRQSRKRGTGGFVIMRPDGLGVESVGDWLVIKRLDDEIELRKQAQQFVLPAPAYPPYYPWDQPQPLPQFPIITYNEGQTA